MIVSAPKITLIMGIVLGTVLLYAIPPRSSAEKPFEELALGGENSVAFGAVDGIPVHCRDLDDLDYCLRGYAERGAGRPVILWLGNSQVHAINQYRAGDETAAPELHRLFFAQGEYFLTASQPNANLQEHYLFFAYLLGKLPIRSLLLPVVFDDMREDGVRASLLDMLKDPSAMGLLKTTRIGQGLLDNQSDQDAAGNDMAALSNTAQERSERYLNQALERLWPLWAERPVLRGKFFLSLHFLRNWALGIHPSSTRKMIPGRYAKNREALEEILNLAKEKGIAVLVYVVPLRSDVKVPYDPQEYVAFKADVADLVVSRNARFADLDGLVPDDLWGTHASATLGADEEIDFMHFQAGGHRLLAAALHRELTRLKTADAGQ